MSTKPPTNGVLAVPAHEGEIDEISALVETLHKTEQRLDELTGGEVDAVADSQGRTYLLRRAQEQLRHSEASKRAAILDALPAHIALLDTHGMIVSVNDGWRRFPLARMLYYPGYAIGVNYLEVCDKAGGDCSAEAHQLAEGIRAVLGGDEKTYSIELACHSPAEQRWFLLTVTPLAEDGRSGAVVMLQDITERKEGEEALKKSETQLRQSQKMDAIGQLAGGVAHDFNNLLTVILGRAELLKQRSDLAEPVRRSINLIHQTGSRAAALTRQLLQFSRQQILQTQVLDVNGLVSGMQEMLRRLISEDIGLVLKFNSKAVSVKADPGQLEQVVMNLVINARDAMPTGGTVTIETANVDLDEEYCRSHSDASPGPHVMLAVGDTGCGMDEAVRARIFEPFFTTKEKGKGTGLGLSTVFGIVKQAGGSIFVYSEVNHGTIFKVYLPEVREKVTSKTSSSALLPVIGGGETILLAEDEVGIRELLNEILTEKGYTVLQATDGEHAIQRSESHKGSIDLLLTDVVMPKVNGKDVAQKLLQDRPDLKVIFMSGYTSDSIVSRGVLDEGIEFLEKPFSPTSVARRVREVLDRLSKPTYSIILSDDIRQTVQ